MTLDEFRKKYGTEKASLLIRQGSSLIYQVELREALNELASDLSSALTRIAAKPACTEKIVMRNGNGDEYMIYCTRPWGHGGNHA